MALPDMRLDITDESCPMTFVRTKLCLERLSTGQILLVRLREGEPTVNVPRAIEDHGHEILEFGEVEDGVFELAIRKAAPR